MSKTKSGGSVKNLQDSPGQRLGVKRFGGEAVKAGNVLVRQRGMTKRPGEGTRVGRDYTIFATRGGKVEFYQTKVRRFSGHRVRRTVVSVVNGG